MTRNHKPDLKGMTLEEMREKWPFAEKVSRQLTEMRTVLSRAETAWNDLPEDSDMEADMEQVLDILEKYRRVKIPKSLNFT